MHGGRFTGDPAYFKHVRKAATKLMEKLSLQVRDVDYFVVHQPNPQFPVRVAKELGFKDEQYAVSLQVKNFGNTYSGSSPVGLAAVLDVAKPEERVLVVSYVRALEATRICLGRRISSLTSARIRRLLLSFRLKIRLWSTWTTRLTGGLSWECNEHLINWSLM